MTVRASIISQDLGEGWTILKCISKIVAIETELIRGCSVTEKVGRAFGVLGFL